MSSQSISLNNSKICTFPRGTRIKSAKNIPLGIGNEVCSLCDHVAYLWEGEDEFARGVQFLEAGLQRTDDCVIFGFAEANEKVLRVLKTHGFNVDQLRASGRLATIGGDDSGDVMLSQIGAHFQSRVEKGTKLIRLLGNIGWGKAGWPHENEILKFEAKVTGGGQAVSVCCGLHV